MIAPEAGKVSAGLREGAGRIAGAVERFFHPNYARFAVQRTDWLREPRGSDVSRTMAWYPIVTFWQVAADLPYAQSVADGHGHRYGTLVLDAWAAITQPPAWSAELSERIRAYLVASADRERELE